MGYTTTFVGALEFTHELKASEIAHLSKILGIDFREAPQNLGRDFLTQDLGQYAIDLKFTKDYSGLEWDGHEKSEAMANQVEFVIAYMRDTFSDFGLKGQMKAQGEDVDDTWVLHMENGKVITTPIPHIGEKIQCPHCGEYFYPEEAGIAE